MRIVELLFFIKNNFCFYLVLLAVSLVFLIMFRAKYDNEFRTGGYVHMYRQKFQVALLYAGVY